MNKRNSNNKKIFNNCFEEGYEDPEERQLKEAKRRLEEMEKPFNPLDIITMRNILIVFIWALIYKIFIIYEFGLVYFFFTIILLIFNNLGERKPWELSAYSIFNPNFERIPGSMTSENIQNGMGLLNFNNNNTINEQINTLIMKLRMNYIEKLNLILKVKIKKEN